MKNPLWDNVLLITFTCPWERLSDNATETLQGHLEKLFRPLTDARIVILDKGSSLTLQGATGVRSQDNGALVIEEGAPIGVLEIPPDIGRTLLDEALRGQTE